VREDAAALEAAAGGQGKGLEIVKMPRRVDDVFVMERE
jgi:hypothetical protein